jgi:hypothetical protein
MTRPATWPTSRDDQHVVLRPVHERVVLAPSWTDAMPRRDPRGTSARFAGDFVAMPAMRHERSDSRLGRSLWDRLPVQSGPAPTTFDEQQLLAFPSAPREVLARRLDRHGPRSGLLMAPELSQVAAAVGRPAPFVRHDLPPASRNCQLIGPGPCDSGRDRARTGFALLFEHG